MHLRFYSSTSRSDGGRTVVVRLLVPACVFVFGVGLGIETPLHATDSRCVPDADQRSAAIVRPRR